MEKTYKDLVEFTVTDKEKLDSRLREKAEKKFISDEEAKNIKKREWAENGFDVLYKSGMYKGENSEFDGFEEFFDYEYGSKSIKGWVKDDKTDKIHPHFSFNWYKYTGEPKYDEHHYDFSFDGNIPDSFIIKSYHDFPDEKGVLYNLFFNYGVRNKRRCLATPPADGYVRDYVFNDLIESGLLVKKGQVDLPFSPGKVLRVDGDEINDLDISNTKTERTARFYGKNHKMDGIDTLQDIEIQNIVIFSSSYDEDKDEVTYKTYMNTDKDNIYNGNILTENIILKVDWKFISQAVKEGVLVENGFVNDREFYKKH